MGPERIELSAKERERLKVLQQVEDGHLKQIEAARRLHLTERQVRRLQARLGGGGKTAESCIDCEVADRTGRFPSRWSSTPCATCARRAMRVSVPPWRRNIWRVGA